MQDISEVELSMLSEVANIGIGHSSSALHRLIGKKVGIDIPKAIFVDKKNLHEFFPEKNIFFGMQVKIIDELEGILLYLIPKGDATTLIDSLNCNPAGTMKDYDAFEVSIIKEIGNILSGSYLSALSDFANLRIMQTTAHLSFDTPYSIIDFVYSYFSKTTPMLLLKNNLTINDGEFNINGNLLMILNDESVYKLIDILKTKYC